MLKEALKIIVRNPKLEARWLNTLSLLEMIGARKISKTVCQTHPSLEVLQHFSDEARHAFVFKQLSEKVLGKVCDEYLCEDEAISYFQMLDQSIYEWLEENVPDASGEANYLVVTAMIEKRAMKMYPLYQATTKNQFVREELRKVIAEESSHKPSIDKKADDFLKENKLDFSSFNQIEQDLFDVFQQAIERTVI